MQEFLSAVALVLVLEGMLPFLFPQRWKRMVFELIKLPNEQLRIYGLVFMLMGLGLLYFIRS